MCEAIHQSRDINRLVELLAMLPTDSLVGGEAELRARARVAYTYGNYRELYKILTSHTFDERHHNELQEVSAACGATRGVCVQQGRKHIRLEKR